MSAASNSRTLLMTLGAALALSACGGGADRVASPGEGAFPPPAGAPPTTPPPTTPPPTTPPPTAGAPDNCPDGLTNAGLIDSKRNCQLPSKIVGALTLSKIDNLLYSLNGRVDVGEDQGGDANNPIANQRSGTLSIEPGVKVFGSNGADFLVVNRGSKINAVGTATDPVVFTSRQSVLGTTDLDSIGQWGGVVLLGRAPISNCPGTIQPGQPTCEAEVEGASGALYGGNSETDSTGELRYVRVMHSGFEVLPNVELNGITLAGLGNGTKVEYVQVHNSSDDGFEWFGGTVNGKYLVATGNDDDSFDTDTGFNGAIQFGLVVQRQGGTIAKRGDRMNEMSAKDSAARPSNPKLANITMVGRSDASAGSAIVLNSGTRVEYYNAVVTGSPACLDIDDANTVGIFQSVFFSCPTAFADDADGAAAAAFAAGSNNVANGTSTLANLFVNGANENAVAAYADLKSINPNFVQVDYIGAIKDANDLWWQGWTCGLGANDPC